MFAWWGPRVVRWRWWVLSAGLALLVAGATWGTGVFDELTGGGFDDPASESYRAQERIEAEFGTIATHLLVLYSSEDATVDDPGFAGPVMATLDRLRQQPEVVAVTSWYDTRDPSLVSTDRHATYAAVRLAGGDDEDALLESYRRIDPLLAAPGVTTQVGGLLAFLDQANAQTERDVVRAELLSFPVLLVLLVLIFRGVVAAATPLLVGAVAILGGFVSTRLLTLVTDVSIFAVNTITVIGLAMAIDYALFIVSRFREELPTAGSLSEAVTRTLATAGRTVMVSGTTIVVALASLLIFPQSFLRSLALGGMSAVGIAMLASLTVLPALLAVLGPRINALPVRLPRRRRAAGADPVPEVGAAEGGWARLARSVMRRPVRYVVAVAVVLLVLASPVVRLQFGGFDERVLPADAQARIVDERIDTEFPGGTTDPITVVVAGAAADQAAQFADRVAQLPGITGATVTAQQGTTTLITVGYSGEPSGEQAWDTVRAVRDLPAPAGAEVLVGGRPAGELDLVDSLRRGLPSMALLMAAAIMVLLFLAFGSVVLPVKAVLMNVVSIGAAFGVVVWGFQDGNLADLLGFTSTGSVEPSMLVLMFAVLFGLSTDYEVFLLSRVREEWDRTGDNTLSVARGLQRTGRIITAAALLLIVVVAGFAAGEISFVKLLGVGMIVAIAVDATLVRALLVPATMRLLGRWNWWAPGPLGRVYRRYGIREAVPVGPGATGNTA
ncbi:MAG: MMPL family transporter [Micromonosporaceae bacterium]